MNGIKITTTEDWNRVVDDSIPKKVIRDKLEKLKENISTAQGEELLIFDSKLDVLKELLNKGE